VLGEEKFLVTGAMGCLGAWTIRALLDEGTPAVALDQSTDRGRLKLLATDEELEAVHFAQGDIRDLAALMALVREQQITHIVHLAALQVPFCKADPVRGAQVNVTGTVNVFESALACRDQMQGLVYASSLAVFGPPHLYPEGRANDESPPSPGTLYGVYKLANEGTARIYAQDHGVGSVGLRPGTVFGVGRDQGLTSAPTLAMLAAAAGRGYHIPYGGASVYQFAPDVARLALSAARAAPDGAVVANLGGASVTMDKMVMAIRDVAPEDSGPITFDDVALPFPSAVDASGLDRLVGGARYTPYEEGVRLTVEAFIHLLARGLLLPPDEDDPAAVAAGGEAAAAREGHR
jgi:UDP-glucuronate 4-epimerase